MATKGEHSNIPEKVKIGKNTVVFGKTTEKDYHNQMLASGKSLIKAGDKQ